MSTNTVSHEHQKQAEEIRDAILDFVPKPHLEVSAGPAEGVSYPEVDTPVYTVLVQAYDNPILSEGDVTDHLRAHDATPLEVVCSRDEEDGISEIKAYFTFTD